MRYYPAFLDITGKCCVVIGGGEVACRKVDRLLDCGAQVKVVSPELVPALAMVRDAGRISHLPAEYDSSHLAGAFLAIGATDRPDVNEQIAQDGRSQGVLVNIVDEPAYCDFIIPSLVQQGDLAIAIGTGGRSPALARALREELEGQYGPEYADLLRIMGTLRDRIIPRGRSSEENRQLFEAVLRSDILREIREGRWDRVRKLIYELTGESIGAEA